MVLGNLGTNVSNFVHKLQCTYFVNQGKDFFFFLLGRGNGMHKQRTCFLLPYLYVSLKNVIKVLFRIGGGGGGGGGQLEGYPPPLCINPCRPSPPLSKFLYTALAHAPVLTIIL